MTKISPQQAAERKARGAFFTPPDISRFMTAWAVRAATDHVLEPSCGEASFLLPAARHLRGLGASEESTLSQLHGQDIHAESIAEASRILNSEGFGATLTVGDFFAREPSPLFDAVIGNPPYVRYQNFAGESRSAAIEASFKQGVRLNQLASSWAAFTVHASAFLKREGRMALVLPAELLSVKYAAQIRRFLLNRFASVRLVLFENLIFPGVLEDVVLLLAEGHGGAKHFEVYQAKNAEDLRDIVSDRWVGFTPRGDDKWTGALLPSQAFELYDEVLLGGNFEVLLDWGDTYLGAVTGNNDFFTLTRSQTKALGLPPSELIRISPPGSRHLKGLTLSDHAWEALASSDTRCYLFLPTDPPSKAACNYIAVGEANNVHQAYKCQIRGPWWRVPLPARPDLLFTYMNHDRPRLIRNAAEIQILNSLYGIRLHAARRRLGQELLPIASLNSVTMLGAEIVGRSYGGGMLKHEPTEADRLPIPAQPIFEKVAERLRALQPQVGALLRRNDIGPAVDIIDRVILHEAIGLSESKIEALRKARDTLMQRRITRGRGAHGKD